MKILIFASVLAGCTGSRIEAAPADHAPALALAPIKSDALCVTRGEVTDGNVSDPTMRGYSTSGGGDAAQLTFTYRGESFESRALAGGQTRRQIGLKLRAQNSCNVVYVMWRLDPTPKLDISVKVNRGQSTHEECGADGYIKVKPYKKTFVPSYDFGSTHTLRAEISGDELFAWIDGKLLWQGRLPDAARSLRGPAGLRSDNIRFDLVELAVPQTDRPAAASCKRDGGD